MNLQQVRQGVVNGALFVPRKFDQYILQPVDNFANNLHPSLGRYARWGTTIVAVAALAYSAVSTISIIRSLNANTGRLAQNINTVAEANKNVNTAQWKRITDAEDNINAVRQRVSGIEALLTPTATPQSTPQPKPTGVPPTPTPRPTGTPTPVPTPTPLPLPTATPQPTPAYTPTVAPAAVEKVMYAGCSTKEEVISGKRPATPYYSVTPKQRVIDVTRILLPQIKSATKATPAQASTLDAVIAEAQKDGNELMVFFAPDVKSGCTDIGLFAKVQGKQEIVKGAYLMLPKSEADSLAGNYGMSVPLKPLTK